MTDADRALLEALGAVSAASPTEWALVTKAVEDAGGIRNVGGMARAEIERAAGIARSLVVKHPGHGDQSVHGGKKGKGGAGVQPAPSAGGTPFNVSNADKASAAVSYAGTQASERMVEHANEMSRTIYGKDSKVGRIDSIDDLEISGIADTLTFAAQSAAELSPSRKRSFSEISQTRASLKDADVAARGLKNKAAQVAARRAIRLQQEELNEIQRVHREAWTGVAD